MRATADVWRVHQRGHRPSAFLERQRSFDWSLGRLEPAQRGVEGGSGVVDLTACCGGPRRRQRGDTQQVWSLILRGWPLSAGAAVPGLARAVPIALPSLILASHALRVQCVRWPTSR